MSPLETYPIPSVSILKGLVIDIVREIPRLIANITPIKIATVITILDKFARFVLLFDVSFAIDSFDSTSLSIAACSASAAVFASPSIINFAS